MPLRVSVAAAIPLSLPPSYPAFSKMALPLLQLMPASV